MTTPTPPTSSRGLQGSFRNLALGLACGTFFLTLAFRRTSWRAVVSAIEPVDHRFILYGIFIYSLYLLARTWRWSFLLAERTEQRPFLSLLRAVTWGTAANAVIPHSGELLRALTTRSPLGLSVSSILGSIAAERFYDFAAVIAITGWTLLLQTQAPQILSDALVALAMMGLVILVPLAILAVPNPLRGSLIRLLAHLLPQRWSQKVSHQLKEIGTGIGAAFAHAHLLPIGLLSLVQWVLVAGCITCSLAAFGLNLPIWAGLVILPITIAGLTLPSAPAYLGTMQVCFIAGLSPFGISDDQAIAASMIYLSIVTFPILIGAGVWYLIHLALYRQNL
ncbi:lysylphosphatidylglycerol synthase transmembrane domain-containing protein [Lyngbya confervoides]|uniref:Flippase-like domain-containing protein n=1 Tax=Lyngbya confervoides BDU141951 TaxID=1574623 RepID=A0ABD4T856_9CYAN|nr:lysylphosphatidylglycerol synthase transmembrane domain-containing protein [Lyngbya confervoides]MCM1984690.1 flippase-like domain-containing protein [Lyngbya confervoides BDU141951]